MKRSSIALLPTIELAWNPKLSCWEAVKPGLTARVYPASRMWKVTVNQPNELNHPTVWTSTDVFQNVDAVVDSLFRYLLNEDLLRVLEGDES